MACKVSKLAAWALALGLTAGLAQAGVVTSTVGLADGFGDGQTVGGVFDSFNLGYYDAMEGVATDRVSGESLSFGHDYTQDLAGRTITGATIELVSAGWGNFATAKLFINGVFVDELADGEDDDGFEYVRYNSFNLGSLLSQLLLDGTDTVTIETYGFFGNVLDDGALDFSRLTITTQEDTGGGQAPEPASLALAAVGLAAAVGASRRRRGTRSL
ncbi:MAG: PEP-CTERM sorting domain-containing protein [Rubrivivax sp.]|nr:PEP-CTERM sorting domain-containing protein [Rubrivivax sp.]